MSTSLRRLSVVIGSVVLGALTSFSRVSATGDYGPDTCLQGWVWREAIPTDHVCVTPEVRSQTAYDNSQAAARRNPNGGPYGPNTCLNGYVWRDAYPSDTVCVTPATRTQAAEDNLQAANRVASLNIWLSDWRIPIFGQDALRYQINGDHFNLAPVILGVYDLNGNTLWTETITAQDHTNAGYIGGSFFEGAQSLDCSSNSGIPVNAYARVYDTVSDRWSASIGVHTGTTC
jgi:hypothetical protein